MNEGMKIHSQLAISRCKALDTEPCHIWDTVVSPRRMDMALAQNCFTLVKTKSDDAWNVRMFICHRCTIIYNSPLESNIFFFENIDITRLALVYWVYPLENMPCDWFFRRKGGSFVWLRTGPMSPKPSRNDGCLMLFTATGLPHYLAVSNIVFCQAYVRWWSHWLVFFYFFGGLELPKTSMGVFEIRLNLPHGYFVGKSGGKKTYNKSSHQILEYLIFKQAHIPWFLTHFHMGSVTNSEAADFGRCGTNGPLGKTSETTRIWTAWW